MGWGTAQEWDYYPPYSYGLLASSHTVDRNRILWDDPVPPGTPLWSIHVIY